MDNNAQEPNDAVETPEVEETQEQEETVEGEKEETPEPEYELKLNGKAEKWKLSKILQKAQISEAGSRAFEEASRLKKEAEALRAKQRDHREILSDKDLKAKIREEIEREIYEELQAESMTPEQKRNAEYEKELRYWREKDVVEKKRRDQEQFDAEVKKHFEEYSVTVKDAIKKVGLPDNGRVIRRMTELLDKNLDLDDPLPTDAIAEMVRDELIAEQRQLMESLDEDKMLSYMDDKVAKKFKKAILAKYKSVPNPVKPDKAPVKVEKDRANEPADNSPADIEDYLERKRKEWRR